MPSAPIPITGYSVCNALGPDRRAVAEGLLAARSGLGPAPFPLPFPAMVGAMGFPLPELASAYGPWANRATRIAYQLVLGLQAELERARARWQPDRIGLVLGTSTSGAEATEEAFRHYLATGELPSAYDFRKQHTFGALADVVRRLCGLRGPTWVVSTTCTSSAKPFGSAARLIQAGILDAVVVGGVDTLCSMTLHGFQALGALSPTVCRPFSRERKGITIGEGGAMVLLERTGEGPALLEAVGESSDAYHISAPHPEGLGARLAMQRALANAGCAASQVDHVNAHGTGTHLNDAAEGRAIEEVLGRDVPVVSTKGYTGHTLGGAGAIECALALICLEEQFVPASLGVEPIDPALRISVPATGRPARIRRVLSNSFAFGGSNVSLLLRCA